MRLNCVADARAVRAEAGALVQADLARVARGDALTAIDVARYTPPSAAAVAAAAGDAAALAALRDAATLCVAHDVAHSDALELAQRRGVAAWQRALPAAERAVAGEQARVRRAKRAVEQLNAERKAEQLRAGERLYAAEREFFELAAKNVQLHGAVAQMEAARRRAEASASTQ